MSLVTSKYILNWNDINEKDSSLQACTSDAQSQENLKQKKQLNSLPKKAKKDLISLQAKDIQKVQKDYQKQKQQNISKLAKDCQINIQKLQEFKGSQVWLFVFAAKNVEETIFKALKKIQLTKIIKNQSGWNILTSRQLAKQLIKQGFKCQQNRNFTIRFGFSTVNNESKNLKALSPRYNYKSPLHNQKTKYLSKEQFNFQKEKLFNKQKFIQKQGGTETLNRKVKYLQKKRNQLQSKSKTKQKQTQQLRQKSKIDQIKGLKSFQKSLQQKQQISQELIKLPVNQQAENINQGQNLKISY